MLLNVEEFTRVAFRVVGVRTLLSLGTRIRKKKFAYFLYKWLKIPLQRQE